MLLGVNIDHVATLRNARGEGNPNLLQAAEICIKSGADGLTTHLREDRRHIKDNDVYDIKKNLNCKLNLEMAATSEMQKIALDLLPHACCIVPERRQEVTTEGGLEVAGNKTYLKDFISPLLKAGIEVSLFITPDSEQVKVAAEIGAPYIELHTGAYSLAFNTEKEEFEFNRLKNAAELAQSLGIKVNAGHGLDYNNVHRMHEIYGLNELNIGHSIISKALFIGLDNAVNEMKNLVNKN
ncbi:pyridoxine 5'-phosphate synthase [bacterium]|nr:pyridoxine 5'-phosphate synthase [bacterium]